MLLVLWRVGIRAVAILVPDLAVSAVYHDLTPVTLRAFLGALNGVSLGRVRRRNAIAMLFPHSPTISMLYYVSVLAHLYNSSFPLTGRSVPPA